MDLGIKGKRVLITGGSKGIGLATAAAFVDEGCKLSLVARDEERLKKVIHQFGSEEAGHDYIAANLREDGIPEKVAKELISRHKCIDIVVHNVGGALGIKEPLSPVKDWMEVWKFNVGIAIALNSQLVQPMRKYQWGRIIHISSISADLGDPLQEPYGGALPYAAAKSYLNAYVKGLGRELARDNVIVTALMPGAVLSEGKYWDKLQKENPDLVDQFLKEYYPIGRFGKAEEIASFAVYLASKQASFAAGSIVPVSGGRI